MTTNISKDRLNRIPIELSGHFKGCDYKVMDWILFRTKVGTKIRIAYIVDDMVMRKQSVIDSLRNLSEKGGWLVKDEFGHYKFIYDKWYNAYESMVRKPDQKWYGKRTIDGNETGPELVRKPYRTNKPKEACKAVQSTEKIPATFKNSRPSVPPQESGQECKKPEDGKTTNSPQTEMNGSAVPESDRKRRIREAQLYSLELAKADKARRNAFGGIL